MGEKIGWLLIRATHYRSKRLYRVEVSPYDQSVTPYPHLPLSYLHWSTRACDTSTQSTLGKPHPKTHMHLLDMCPPALLGWDHGNLANLDGAWPSLMTTSHVTVWGRRERGGERREGERERERGGGERERERERERGDERRHPALMH